MLNKNYSTISHPNRTTLSIFERQNKSTLDMHRTSKLSSNHDRPDTSFILVHRLNSSNQREVTFAYKEQIDSVQQDLSAAYQLDLTKYLHKKFRNLLVRKHEYNPAKPTVVTIQNPENLETFCSKMEVSLILDKEKKTQSKSKSLIEKRGIQKAYLLNAKQRISRLVELKRQRQANFSQLKQKIRQRVKRKQQTFAVIGRHQLNTIEDKQLSEKIRAQFEHRIQRYKQRISSKLRIASLKKNESHIINE